MKRVTILRIQHGRDVFMLGQDWEELPPSWATREPSATLIPGLKWCTINGVETDRAEFMARIPREYAYLVGEERWATR